MPLAEGVKGPEGLTGVGFEVGVAIANADKEFGGGNDTTLCAQRDGEPSL